MEQSYRKIGSNYDPPVEHTHLKRSPLGGNIISVAMLPVGNNRPKTMSFSSTMLTASRTSSIKSQASRRDAKDVKFDVDHSN